MEILRKTVDWMLHSNQKNREADKETLLKESEKQLRGRERMWQWYQEADRWMIAFGAADTLAAAGLMSVIFIKGMNPLDVAVSGSIGPLVLSSGIMMLREDHRKLAMIREVIQRRA